MHNQTYKRLTLERNIAIEQAKQVEQNIYHAQLKKHLDSLMLSYEASSKRREYTNNRIAQMTAQLNRLKMEKNDGSEQEPDTGTDL